MIRKIVLLFVIVVPFALKAQNTSDEKISIRCINIPLHEALSLINQSTGFTFYYSSSKIDIFSTVSIIAENQTLSQVMEIIKSQLNIEYKITGRKVILFTITTHDQKLFSVCGYVQDRATGERLIGANIIFDEIGTGTNTNAYGFFSYLLPSGKYHLRCSYIGYEPLDTMVDVSNSPDLIFCLNEASTKLQEVNLTSKMNDKVNSMKLGYDELPLKLMSVYPMLLGEKDVLQFIKLMPGVRSSNEGANGLYIRGALPSHTTFLIDDAPMFNMYHISGLFSTINPDAIKDLRIYKSNLPVKMGDALSSVVDIRLRDGSNQNFIVTGGISTISSRITLEGPIVKDKSSFIVSARRSYIDKFVKLFNLEQNLDFYFYDINAKVNYIFNPRNRIYVSGYRGNDVLRSGGAILWGNSLLSARWNKVFSQQLFSNLTLLYSAYKHSFEGENSNGPIRMNSYLKSMAIKYDFSLLTVANRRVNFGIKSNYNEIVPAKFKSDYPVSSKLIKGAKQRWQVIHQLYGDASYTLGTHWAVEGGTRLSLVHGRDSVSRSVSISLEPLVKIKYQIAENSSLKAAYSRNYQYYHSSPVFDLIIPFERFIFSGFDLPPQYADHISSGYFLKHKSGLVEFSAEVYYSWMHNQFRFQVQDDIILEDAFRKIAIAGDVNSYGLEISVGKQTGRVTGLLSYTLSKVDKHEEKYAGWYSPYYDRRHDVSLSMGVAVTKRVTISGTWVGMTGNPYNYPIAKYQVRGRTIPYYSTDGVYNKRMPFYHRLDLGCAIKLGKGNKRFSHSLSFNVYNIYLKGNPVFYYYSDIADNDISKDIESSVYNSLDFKQISQFIFKFVPSFSYEFKFE